jgi:lipopolysaccharide transport protein LptA
VKTLRFALPAIAIASLGLYSAALVVSSRLKSRDIAVGQISVDPSNLRMADPRYSGFSKDGSEYKVHAKSAVSDLKMSAPVRLDVIDGQITQPTGVVTYIKAKWGTYDQKKELLELYEKIDIDGSTGMKARLTRATLFAKENRIISPEPVWAETETGNIRANTMALDTKARKAAFQDAVEVTLKPAKPDAHKDPATQPPRETQLFGLDANSGEPVIVNSHRLDVDDLAKTALFREAVVARQGTAELQAPELDVAYSGDASVGQPAAAKPAEGADGTKLKSIKARGGVTMNNKDSRAESETLDYDAGTGRVTLVGNVVMTQQPERRLTAETALLDQRTDTALITGEVVVTQGRNILKGTRLAIDRKVGTARLTSPAQANVPAGRISSVLYQNNAGKPASQPAKEAPADGAEQGLGLLGANFKSDPNAPIEVEAVSLDVNDRKHTALYLGAVVAKQGDFVVRTEEMTAHFTGEMGLLAGSPQSAPREKSKGNGPGGAELKRIEARRNVVVTGKDGQQATGEWANFDVKSNNIVMGGNVTVTQGKQLVRAPAGMRLVIDLGTGVTRFEADPGAPHAKSGPQVSGAFATSVAPPPAHAGGATTTGCPPGAICKSGRLEAIFYPNQIKDKAKQKIDEVGDKAPEAAAAAKEAARGLAKRLPEASSWSTTNQSPGKP